MVDDNEFVKRRHLSRGRPRKYDPSTAEDQSTAPSASQSQQQQSPNQSTSLTSNANQHSKVPTNGGGGVSGGVGVGTSSKYNNNNNNNNDHSNAMQSSAPHLMHNVTTNLGQPSNGMNHHYFSSPVPSTQ